MKWRILSVVLALLFILGLMNYDAINVYVVNTIRTHEPSYRIDFEHSLSWYLIDNRLSTTYCPQLAYMAAAFSDAAYSRSDIEALLSYRGFNAATRNYGNVFIPERPAFAMGRKYADNGERIVTVIIRGSRTPNDWVTDFNAQTSNSRGAIVHRGFYDSMRHVVDELTAFLEVDWMLCNNTTYFITGHSYGGAVTNLLAREIIRVNEASGNEIRGRVFAYTFGSPEVTQAPLVTAREAAYSSIFNVVNIPDPVPRVLQESFISRLTTSQWVRFGQDIHFDSGHELDAGVSGFGAVLSNEGHEAHNKATYLDLMRQQIEPDSSETVTTAAH